MRRLPGRLPWAFKQDDGTPDIEAWLERVTREEKIPLRHYMEDIVWPTVALKKLVGRRAGAQQEDLDKAFAATFGPRARCRIIVLDNQRRAQEVWQLARQNPTAESIGGLAETYSVDPTTRPCGARCRRSSGMAASRRSNGRCSPSRRANSRVSCRSPTGSW